MSITKELISDPRAVECMQICHEKGRGRVYTAGLDPEVFADTHNRLSQMHTNGGVEAERQQLDYDGGPSAADRMDL